MYESDNRKSNWYPDFASDLKEQILNSNGFTHNCTSLQYLHETKIIVLTMRDCLVGSHPNEKIGHLLSF